MIIFEKILIESFGSIKGPFEYVFDTPGINLILGKNGSGKTTILNALAWALYKQMIKKGSSIQPWKHTQDKKYKGTMVSVNFRDDRHSYQITRCKDYKGNIGKPNQKGGNKLFFFVDGKLNDKKYKSNIQPQIEKAIGYSFNLFKNAILFGQEVERLMKESGPNKRKVFEEAFDTSFIEVAKDKVEQRLKKRMVLQDKAEVLTDKYQDQWDSYEKNTKQMVGILEQNRVVLKKQVKKIEGEIKEIDSWLFENNQDIEGQIAEIEKDLEKAQSKIKPHLRDEEFKLNMWINGKKQEWENVWDEIKDTLETFREKFKCPTCGRPLGKDRIKEMRIKVKSKIRELKKRAHNIDKELTKMKAGYREVKEAIKNQDKYSVKVLKIKSSLVAARLDRDQIAPKIALLEEKRDRQLPALKKNIQKLKKEQLVLQAKREKEKEAIYQLLNQAKSEYEYYRKRNELDEWLVKDPLSSKGLKAYIFESMLQDLNNSLTEYRPFIDFSIRVYVELDTARKDIKIAITKKKEEIPYEDLSKGQKQLTDAILAFAINDTITKNKPINIFLMDEVFESLSIDNVEIISNIVMKKATKYCIHMITHLTSFQPRGIKKTMLQLDNHGHTVKAA